MRMGERKIKFPPFSIARRDGATLTSQIEDGLRNAIATGFYGDGDFLPGYVELAGRLGVSTGIARRAIARLIADGLCHPQRGVGLRVCSKTPAKVGNVLVVIGGDAGSYRYYMSSMVEHLRRHLSQHHFAISRANVANRDGQDDFSELKEALNRHVSAAVILDHSPGTEDTVAASGGPYVLLSPAHRSSGAPGILWGDTRKISETIAAHCAACGARRVLMTGLESNEEGKLPAELEAALHGLGMETRWSVPGKELRDGTAAELVQATIDDFSRICHKGCVETDGFQPDMIVFLDDYVAQGALLAMTAAGIRIPEDVQVVTMANKGLGPNWLKPLTQYEVDAAAEAEILSDLVRDCLAARKRHHVRTTSFRFIEGETTLVASRAARSDKQITDNR
jgi:DNA-binding LacI/PurR family transcriptional regulator